MQTFLPAGWLINMDNGQYRAKRMDISGGVGKRAAVRAGGSASRASGDQSSTDPGGGSRRNKQRKSNWWMPTENCKRGHWVDDSQEFPSLETRQRMAGNTRDQPVPVPPKLTGDRRAPDAGSPEFGPGDVAG